MKTYAQEALDIFGRLNEAAQISLLNFAKFLEANEADSYYDEAEMAADIAAYDEAKANDCGYRISSADLRRKYGI